jgi:hypothetical protein
MTEDDFHAKMAADYQAQREAEWRRTADQKRRHNHFQVRLPPDLADKLRDYMKSRGCGQNQALITIISKFFH